MWQKSTAHEQRRSRGESRKLRFGSGVESHGSKNLTGGTTWSSQSTSTDWLTRIRHWSSPRSKLAYKKPTSARKLRKFPVTSGQGSKHRDWTASRWWARWRSQSSSCQHHVITWRGLIPVDHEYLDSVAWPCHDCEVAPVWHHDVTNPRTCQFSAVCLTAFPFEFRPRTFTIGFYWKNSIISELMILECSFPLTFFIPTLDATLILEYFSDECFRNSLEKKRFNFQRDRTSHFENTDMFPYGNIGGMQSVNNPIWRSIGLVYPKQRVNTQFISDCLVFFICSCWSFLTKFFWFWVFFFTKKMV